MAVSYRHTQIGYLVLVVFGGALIIISFLVVALAFNWVALVVLIIIVICLGLFSTLTVEVNRDALEIRFGAGVIQRRFPLKDIESCQVVRNPWYYGWGIRLTPHGWLYNVSGSFAVEIRLKNGKKYRIGTDDPQGLNNAIRRYLEGQ